MLIVKHRDDIGFINIQNKRMQKAYDTKIGFCKKSFGHRFVMYFGPTYYNSLPVEIKGDTIQNSLKVKKNIYK